MLSYIICIMLDYFVRSGEIYNLLRAVFSSMLLSAQPGFSGNLLENMDKRHCIRYNLRVADYYVLYQDKQTCDRSRPRRTSITDLLPDKKCVFWGWSVAMLE